MATNGEIIYDFKELTEKSNISDDTGWSDSQIFSFLTKTRVYLISERLKREGRVSRFNYMTTPCLKLESVPESECPCPPPDGCETLRTVNSIPNVIGSIEAVFNNNSSKIYAQTDDTKSKYRKHYSYKSLANATSYYVRDNGNSTYIYVNSLKPLTYIKFTALPENPLDFQTMPDCDGKLLNPCRSFYDHEWKLDSTLTKLTMDLCIQVLLKSKIAASDLNNNSIDDLVSMGTPNNNTNR